MMGIVLHNFSPLFYKGLIISLAPGVFQIQWYPQGSVKAFFRVLLL